jgi:alpha-D-ribose 1-methylphosphonate 5-triphosphate synthase subunit PhnG
MKREPRWVTVFLKQLERTGNVRLAAGQAGVDFSTAYQRRKRHAEFAERWEASLQQLMETPTPLDHHPTPAPPHRGEGKTVGGEELNVRPDGKVIKGSEARWGKRAETRFLTELTVSANVRLAAEAAGFSTTAVYQRRMKSRHFMAAWDAAVETGKARVQAYLVEAATRTFDPDELPIGDGREVPKVSIGEAINIARLKGGPSTSLGTNGEEEYDEDHLKEVRERIVDKLQRLREKELSEFGEAGWVEWQLPPGLHDRDMGTVWLPPGYRLVGPET